MPDGANLSSLAPLVKVEEIHHSKVGASSADRWMHCKGSNNLIRKLTQASPELMQRGSPAAALGTAAHTICQTSLDAGTEAWEHMGTKLKVDDWTFECDQEMADSVQRYLTYIRDLITKYKDFDPVLYVEKGMGSVLDEDAYGTSDCMLHVRKLKLLYVIDYKNGMVCVEPDYPQPKYYAALAIENLPGAADVEKVILTIVQPRMPHPKGRIREFETTAAAITGWFENEAVPAMQDTRDPDALLTLGKWCRFCPAKYANSCPLVNSELSNFNIASDPETLTDEELGDFLVKGDIIRRQLERMQEEALRRALSGSTVKGHKLVKQKANRVYKKSMEITAEDGTKSVVSVDDAARAKWGDEAFTKPALLSPAQLEKNLDGASKFVRVWGYMPDSGLTLARDDDKREAHVPLMSKFDVMLTEDRLRGVDIPE
jgi:hypothetical protein